MLRSITLTIISFSLLTPLSAAPRGGQKKPKRELGAINPIASRSEYDHIIKAQRPTVIVFNSPTCQACDTMKESLTSIAKQYDVDADFYSVMITDEAFTGLGKELEIKAYPTTLFLKKGFKRSERGSMEPREIDAIVYELVTGRQKPVSAPKKTTPEVTAPKESSKTTQAA